MMTKVVSQRLNHISVALRRRLILTGTPSTRRLLDGVAVRFSRRANFGPRGRVGADSRLAHPVDLHIGGSSLPARSDS